MCLCVCSVPFRLLPPPPPPRVQAPKLWSISLGRSPKKTRSRKQCKTFSKTFFFFPQNQRPIEQSTTISELNFLQVWSAWKHLAFTLNLEFEEKVYKFPAPWLLPEEDCSQNNAFSERNLNSYWKTIFLCVCVFVWMKLCSGHEQNEWMMSSLWQLDKLLLRAQSSSSSKTTNVEDHQLWVHSRTQEPREDRALNIDHTRLRRRRAIITIVLIVVVETNICECELFLVTITKSISRIRRRTNLCVCCWLDLSKTLFFFSLLLACTLSRQVTTD